MANPRRFIGGLLGAAGLSVMMAAGQGAELTDAPAAGSSLPPLVAPIPDRILRFRSNAAEICGPLTGGAANPEVEREIRSLRDTLQHSRTGASLLRAVERYDRDPTWICYQDTGDSYATHYPGRGVLVINSRTASSISAETKTASTIHEMRHLWQELNLKPRYAERNPEESVQTQYVIEADAEAILARVSWELKEAGYPAIWNQYAQAGHYRRGSMCYAGIARAFESAVHNGSDLTTATRAAFRAWYDNEMLVTAYRQAGWRNYYLRGGTENTTTPVAASLEFATLDSRGPEMHTDATCNRLPDWYTGGVAPIDVPAPAIAEAYEKTGTIPGGRGRNYIREGGGLRQILADFIPGPR